MYFCAMSAQHGSMTAIRWHAYVELSRRNLRGLRVVGRHDASSKFGTIIGALSYFLARLAAVLQLESFVSTHFSR
jgi:hypothetical protein